MGKLIKSFSDNFTMIHNDILDDERLHLKSVGLFMHLWHQPDNWSFYLTEVTRHHRDGIDATRSAVEELERYGYLKRFRVRNKKGQFGDNDWIINDQPSKNVDSKAISPTSENHTLEKSTQEKSMQENTTLLSTNSTKYLSQQSTDVTNLSRGKATNRVREKKTKHESKFDKSKSRWIKQTSKALVDYAVSVSKERASDKRSELSYFESVMNDWSRSNVKTVAQAKHRVNWSKASKQVANVFEPSWMREPLKKSTDAVSEKRKQELKERIRKLNEKNQI